jgi:uncharacterized protein (TIGR03437 family)
MVFDEFVSFMVRVHEASSGGLQCGSTEPFLQKSGRPTHIQVGAKVDCPSQGWPQLCLKNDALLTMSHHKTVMGTIRSLFCSLCALLALAGTATAQMTITNVFNAASRVVNGSLAQGALLAITGRGVGTSDIQQATFPLPTTAGLGGVTVQISAGGGTYDGILVYTRPNEVGAILPSAVPAGPATLTVNNNGATASKSINVIDAAFGIFTQRYGIAAGPAIAFNANADGSVTANSTTQSVMPGGDVIINGTGLGAIPSDETQSGVTDVPATSIKIFVGIKAAAVVSAGRGACCDGLDPAYQVPQGIAAWDVVRFTVPEGATGCYIPVTVQIGKTISNLATISIDPGGACKPTATGLPVELADKLSGQTGMSTGAVGLGRATGISVNNRGVVVTNKNDGGSAAFVRYPDVPALAIPVETAYPTNICSINGWPGANGPGSADVNGNPVALTPLKAVGLDAGTPIVVKGGNGSRNIVKQTVGQFFDYPSANFGDNFYDPGHYTVTDAAGGKDVGAFSAAIDVPAAHLIWTNIPDVTKPLDRSQDLVIKWTGGIPGTQVTVGGAGVSNGINAAFQCAAPVEAGEITIPSWVLMQIPPTASSPIRGGLSVLNSTRSLFTATGLDAGILTYTESYHLSLQYQ